MVFGFDGSRAFVNQRSGTENYSYQLLKALAKIDRKNSYMVYTKSFNLDTAVSTMKFPENFQLVKIPWKRLWTQGGLAIQTFKDELDVLFVPAHTLPVIRKPGLKTVVTVHDLGSDYLPQMHQVKQRLYLGFMQKFQLKSATKIIAVSKSTKQDLVKRIGIDPDKIEVVYEGYDKDLFKSVKGDILVNSLKPYYLFVGTVQPRKNIARLIRAFAKFLSTVYRLQSTTEVGSQKKEDLKLVIAGSKGWLSDEIYKLPKKLGAEDRVKFLGYVPEKDLPALYSGAIALVFPSLFEGFGLPILEAQACGCPVLTSNLSSMPEVAGKAAILVDPYSVEEITSAMIRVQVSGYRLQLIKKGLENIKRFSWEKAAKETLAVLENA